MLHPHLRSSPSLAGQCIGLLGGSFNPAHDGHRSISLYALKRLKLNQVWWLVSPQNPLKPSKGMAPLATRLKEARKVASHNRIAVMDMEVQLRTRYTFDTLRALRRRFPKTRFVWLMGADNLNQIPAWHEGLAIFHVMPVAVFRRPAYAVGRGLGKAAQRHSRSWHPAKHASELASLPPPAWLVLDNPLNKLSATEIRGKSHKKGK
ncbi:MAG: nicotinate-nucleotide adenylyltransferase [Alphaproteobacteria bacterium]|nr:nicotinate-nucleotide adenylyltransferase [Alphaproteobacteria bacterium]